MSAAEAFLEARDLQGEFCITRQLDPAATKSPIAIARTRAAAFAAQRLLGGVIWRKFLGGVWVPVAAPLHMVDGIPF